MAGYNVDWLRLLFAVPSVSMITYAKGMGTRLHYRRLSEGSRLLTCGSVKKFQENCKSEKKARHATCSTIQRKTIQWMF